MIESVAPKELEKSVDKVYKALRKESMELILETLPDVPNGLGTALIPVMAAAIQLGVSERLQKDLDRTGR